MTVTEHRSFCRICLATCGTIVRVDDGKVVSIRGDAAHPVSQGYLCPKGRAYAGHHNAPSRLDGALVRRGDRLEPVSHEEAHRDLAEVLQRVTAESGPGAIGVFLGTGSFMDSAGGWAARRLMAGLRTEHRYSTATVDAVAKTLVAGLMAGSSVLIPQPDDDATLLVLLGINPVVSHGHATPYPDPVTRLRAAVARGEVLVVDPRVTETARLSTRHLAPRPGTDHALLAHALRDVLRDADRAALARRAVRVDELAQAVEGFDARHTAELTGLRTEELAGFVASIRRAGRFAIVTGTGSTMTGTANLTEWMAWALLVVTDSFDQPGGMWFNPGVSTRLDRRETLPGIGPDRPGAASRTDIARCGDEWPSALIPAEIDSGRLRALVVAGGNIAVALPDPHAIERAMAKVDALVVLETHRSETVGLATHAFGCADQLEREDLLPLEFNAHPVYQHYTDAVVTPLATRPPMWRTLVDIGAHIGVDVLPADLGPPDDVTTERVLERMARGTSIPALRAVGGLHVEAPALFGWVTTRLPLGRWNLAPEPLVAQLHAAGSVPAPPLVLTPRRQGKRLNSQAFQADERPDVWLHPATAAAVGATDGQLVEVRSGQGALRLPVRVTESIVPGAASVPHGWADANVNALIGSNDLDPLSGMARLGAVPVTITPL